MATIRPKSSCVISFSYKAESAWNEAELTVTYNNHGLSADVYVYSGVPEYVYNALLAAPSKGKALNELVKGVYDFEKV